jgi:hypothetical protein
MKYLASTLFRTIFFSLIVFVFSSFIGSGIGLKIINRSQLAVITNPVVPLSNFSTFEMQVVSTAQLGNTITITTTGAQYILTSTDLEMWRRIDPHTNTVNPRKVATLTFNSNLGPLSIETSDNSKAVVQSSLAKFEFMSDSLFFITAKSPFTYTHTNLITNAPWNKGTGRDRMWTDGYGGSLHAQVAGGTSATNNPDSTTISMATNDMMAHMVYPPKLFDYEGFYGASAKPFVVQMFNESQTSSFVISQILAYASNNFGVVEVFGTLYTNNEQPTLVSPNVMGYSFRNETLIRQLVEVAHAHGFKVITYLSYPSGGPLSYLQGGPEWVYPAGHPQAGQHQDIATTLAWMKDFQTQFNLDGWYFDNADAGGFLDDYNFIRQVRTDIGDDGIIYHHDSVDIWGGWTGLRAVMIDAYVNYALAGETGREPPNITAQIQGPNDPYLRFYSSGYGLSQAYGSHLRLSNRKLALSEGELDRAIMENFVGMIDYNVIWRSDINPPYQIKKAKYLNGTLPTDVDWPINPDTGWFRPVQNFQISYNSSTSTTLTWQTNEPATSEVAWTDNGVWWGSGPMCPTKATNNCRIIDTTLTTNHQITITGLTAGANYEFRIRSCAPTACLPDLNSQHDFILGKTVRGTVSEVISIPFPDTTPPSVPANLTPTVVSTSQINLHWSPATDPIVSDQITSGLVGYQIYRDNIQIAKVTDITYQDTGLTINTAYQYAVAAYDAVGNPSVLSPIVSATTFLEAVFPDLTPPSTITDFKLTSLYTQGRAGLNWHAPYEDSDDLTSGVASSYDIRYSFNPITEISWNSSTGGQVIQVADEPLPRDPNTVEIYILPGLLPGYTYYVAIKSQDEAGNISVLSNNVIVTIPPTPVGGGDPRVKGEGGSPLMQAAPGPEPL